MLQVAQWVLVELRILGLLTHNQMLEFKISLDECPFWGHGQVMVGIMCCDDAAHYGTQPPNHVFPFAILTGDEDYTLLSKVLQPVLEVKRKLKTDGVEARDKIIHLHFKCMAFVNNIFS